MSDMKSLTQRGAINILLIPLILVVLFLFGAGGFGYWAYSSRQDYKDNSDQKSAIAVNAAITIQKTQDTKDNAEANKLPLATFVGPSAFGSINLKYPKTWSGYMEQSDNGGIPIEGWFYPNIVPSTSDPNSSFALRIEVSQTSYDQAVAAFGGQVSAKQVTMKPFVLAKVPSVIGTRIEGQITPTKQGTMIILPIRNMTLKVWTEADQFKPDLENNVLPNFTFQP
jgi:hypothetical protein